MDPTQDRWLTRQELANRYQVPIKTIATWASAGTGPRYAIIGHHARYRLSDVIAWEEAQLRDRASANRLDDDVEQGAVV